MGDHDDTRSLLNRTVTFKAPTRAAAAPESTNLLTKIVGSKTAPNNRVSESLDYEPIQNQVYFERLKIKKEGKKKLYG